MPDRPSATTKELKNRFVPCWSKKDNGPMCGFPSGYEWHATSFVSERDTANQPANIFGLLLKLTAPMIDTAIAIICLWSLSDLEKDM